jgi:hypothetical protein
MKRMLEKGKYCLRKEEFGKMCRKSKDTIKNAEDGTYESIFYQTGSFDDGVCHPVFCGLPWRGLCQ